VASSEIEADAVELFARVIGEKSISAVPHCVSDSPLDQRTPTE